MTESILASLCAVWLTLERIDPRPINRGRGIKFPSWI